MEGEISSLYRQIVENTTSFFFSFFTSSSHYSLCLCLILNLQFCKYAKLCLASPYSDCHAIHTYHPWRHIANCWEVRSDPNKDSYFSPVFHPFVSRRTNANVFQCDATAPRNEGAKNESEAASERPKERFNKWIKYTLNTHNDAGYNDRHYIFFFFLLASCAIASSSCTYF